LRVKHLLIGIATGWLAVAGLGCSQPEPDGSARDSAYLPRRAEPGEPEAVYEAKGRGEVRRVANDAAAEATAGGGRGSAADAGPGNRQYTVDAMIGQVNGKPIYASSVFRRVGLEQLRRLGERNDPRAFAREIQPLMNDTVRQMVTDALLLAEAEASLTEQEEKGLLGALQQFREQLISEAGGFIGGAQAKLRKERGMTLEEAVEERRQEILIQKYMRERLFPRINVNRRKVERYYHDQADQFNPPAQITVRLVIAPNPDTAAQVSRAMQRDKFDEAAAAFAEQLMVSPDPRTFNARKEAFDQLAFEPLNTQIRQLEPGEVSPRLDIGQGRTAWVKLIDVQQPESKPLKDVYLQIERRLRAADFERANRDYMQQLLEEGNHTPIDQMMRTLMVVATNRFATGSG